jgi:nitrite reductase (NADH) large subunit
LLKKTGEPWKIMKTTTTNSSLPVLAIVGNGMVGHHCVEQLLAQGALQHYQIHVFGEESRRAYDRVHLSEYFNGRDAESLAMSDASLYQVPGLTLFSGLQVQEIDRTAKQLITANGNFAYDTLVLATGSYPFVPPIEGAEGDARLVYRTLDDLDSIRAAANISRRGVVIGGGLLGLEAANALRSLGLETHVVEFAPRLMPVQLDGEGGAALKARIEELGVSVHLNKTTQAIVAGNEYRYQMQFADDTLLETDLIVFSAGIRPQDHLARQSHLDIAPRGGISINNDCRTSDESIYAIGECAAWNERIFGLVAPGYQMARHVAALLCQQPSSPFTGADMSTKLKLLGVDVGSIGDAAGNTPGSRSYRFIDEANACYRRLVVSADGKKALGAILVGDNSYYDTLLQYVNNCIDLPADPSGLILPSNSATPALGVDALPATATICSCHNVSKGAICDAIDAGCQDIAELKSCTKAATGCGGCAALLKQVFEHELTARGVAVDKSLCEHFSYTRQELYDIVRVEAIESFDELLTRHGKGHLGCTICKPAVGSILASCWNRPIMNSALVPLQDTNDTFMANMQKNGTYSVVPRIPAGEITPDALMVIGQIAKKYDLYTKITGGQRIDLFGAQLHELPDIWSELIAAGFETGHAYGKSTRTVKSCVGSTWCRYGVQDSVQMALDIEHRYKGLRSPHKLKFAVSGCTRECAEAQSKDIGIIATENGWNLYVCGNGGMRPRHAELFATDLDDATLIRYIDRVLMFYIRTADKLQRTSVWRESLEGGLDYLKAVVIDDSLGLAAELEAQMQLIVDRYECEWANVLNDPDKLKRFRTFVNDQAADDDIRFIRERNQRRPLPACEPQLIAIAEEIV